MWAFMDSPCVVIISEVSASINIFSGISCIYFPRPGAGKTVGVREEILESRYSSWGTLGL